MASWHILGLLGLRELVWFWGLQLYRSGIYQVQRRNHYRGSKLRRCVDSAGCRRKIGRYLSQSLILSKQSNDVKREKYI